MKAKEKKIINFLLKPYLLLSLLSLGFLKLSTMDIFNLPFRASFFLIFIILILLSLILIRVEERKWK